MSRSAAFRPVIVCLAVAVAAAGSTVSAQVPERPEVRRAGDIVFRSSPPPTEIVSPMELDDEMRAWLRREVDELASPMSQIYELVRRMEAEDGLDLQYEAGYTGTAREVFETGLYNCLSFSMLFTAFARELGMPTHFLNVDRITRYRKEGDVVVVSGHTTVGFGLGPERKVLEFDVGPDVNYRAASPISDQSAQAHFYSNRGAEMIRSQEVEKAIDWLEVAVALDPGLAGAWVNLGVARRRDGDLDGAERAYGRAIELEPRFFSAYANLAALVRLRGDEAAEKRFNEILRQRGNRNPYFFLELGDESLERGRIEEAQEFYLRALRLSTDRAGAMAAVGRAALAAGDREAAKRWLKKAKRLDRQAERVVDLASRLGESALQVVSEPEPSERSEPSEPGTGL